MSCSTITRVAICCSTQRTPIAPWPSPPLDWALDFVGQLVATGTAALALPAFANVDPLRMFQLQARLQFLTTDARRGPASTDAGRPPRQDHKLLVCSGLGVRR